MPTCMYHSRRVCPCQLVWVTLCQENVRLGKKLATGGFGTVYKADLVDEESGDVRSVIVKKVRHHASCRTLFAAPFLTRYLQARFTSNLSQLA